MDKTEAKELAEMERERDKPITDDTVEKLAELF